MKYSKPKYRVGDKVKIIVLDRLGVVTYITYLGGDMYCVRFANADKSKIETDYFLESELEAV